MEKPCTLCPRKCKIDRSKGETGLCRSGNDIVVARSMVHMWEEPPISGTHGSGAIFFSGCSLRCVFCQNRPISHDCIGKVMSESDLGALMLELQEKGVHNINLVTPTHFADKIILALKISKPNLTIPIVYNTSGYESVDTLKGFEGLVDIYLPDFKYSSSEVARKYSSAPDYPEIAEAALIEMYRQVGRYEYDSDMMLKKGLVVRHLVLPTLRKDSMALLDRLSLILPKENILLSLMSQYTPEFYDGDLKELKRRITSFEYETVLAHAEKLGFTGFMQGRASATSIYTPKFNEK